MRESGASFAGELSGHFYFRFNDDLVADDGIPAFVALLDVLATTGYLDTDYAAKGRAAIEALAKYDMVCVHVEAPDEASHEGRHDAKIAALEAAGWNAR